MWVRILLSQGALDTTLCDEICQWPETGWWFFPGTPVSSTNKTDRHDITEIWLKVALSATNLSLNLTFIVLFILEIFIKQIHNKIPECLYFNKNCAGITEWNSLDLYSGTRMPSPNNSNIGQIYLTMVLSGPNSMTYFTGLALIWQLIFCELHANICIVCITLRVSTNNNYIINTHPIH